MSQQNEIKLHRISYDYSDAPTLLAFSKDETAVRGIMGPFGSGKSSACVMQIVLESQEQEPGSDGIRRTRWACIRNTYRQLEDTTIKTFFEWLPPAYCGKYNKSNHNYIITCFAGMEIEILFRALDRPDHVSNLLSLELTSAWVNEAREVPWALIKALRGRLNRYPSRRDGPGSTKPRLIMDTNPPTPRSWWYQLFEVDKRPNIKLFKQPGGKDKNAENTSHLGPTYYDDMADLYDEDELKVYRDGEYGFIKDGKPVYPTYRDNLHSRIGLTPIPGITLIRGWDFGLTPACVVAQVTPLGQLRIINEYTTERAGFDDFSSEVLKDMNVRYRDYEFEDYGDETGRNKNDNNETSCFDIAESKDIHIEPVSNVLQTRLESVRRGLNTLVDGEPALVVDKENCPTIREGFTGGYKYRKILSAGLDERHQEEPLKNEYSHPHDCVQYICVIVFGDYLVGLVEQHEVNSRIENNRAHGHNGDVWTDNDYTDQQQQDSEFDPFDI